MTDPAVTGREALLDAAGEESSMVAITPMLRGRLELQSRPEPGTTVRLVVRCEQRAGP